MININNFIFKPENLSVEHDIICKTDIAALTDDEVRVLTDKYTDRASESVSDTEIVGMVLWGADKQDTVSRKMVLEFWSKHNSDMALKMVYSIWQNRYDSGSFSELCGLLLKNIRDDKTWIKHWKLWMTASDIPTIAAGYAAAYCLEKQQSYNQWTELSRIDSNSRLGKTVHELFFCFCSEKDFQCTDRELVEYIENMGAVHRERLLRNILRMDTGKYPDALSLLFSALT